MDYIAKCKDCGKEVKVSNSHCTYVRCDDCKQKLKQKDLEKRSKNICTNCGKEFDKDPHTRDYHCPACKAKVEFRKSHTVCSRCKKLLHRDEFPDGNTTVCIRCRKEENLEKHQKVYIRKCKRCGKEVVTTNRFATIVNCQDCENKKQIAKKKTYIRKCLGCSKDIMCKGHVTFVYCEECKEKRNIIKIENRKPKYAICSKCKKTKRIKRMKLIDNQYICRSCIKYKNGIVRHCAICNKDVIVDNIKATFVKCNDCKNNENNLTKIVNGKFKRICVKCKAEFDISPKSRVYKCPNCRKKVKEPVIFAKKKHFGYYGLATDGHKWWSLNEQDLEEWLIARRIKHEPHPRIGKSLKHADQYLPEYDLYIEMDGLSRKNDIDWQGKLSLYETLELKYKILKPVTHFIESEKKCFDELDSIFIEIEKVMK